MKHRLVKIMALVLALMLAFSTPVFAQTDMVEKVTVGIFDACMGLIDDGLTQLDTDESESMDGSVDAEGTIEPEQPSNPENPDEPTTEPENPEIPDNPDVPDEPVEPEQPKPTFDEIPGDTVVGKMYICSEIVFLGHSWIYIESTFDGEIPVGCYTVTPFGSVSVGTFLMTRRDGMGVYYNVERYSATKFGLRSANWLGMDITKDQLLKVNKEIKGWNYWDLYFNCTFFASKVWNSVSDKFFMPMMFPVFTKAQANTKGGNKNVAMQPHDNPEDCFKQRGSGDGAKLETVSTGSLKTRIG